MTAIGASTAEGFYRSQERPASESAVGPEEGSDLLHRR